MAGVLLLGLAAILPFVVEDARYATYVKHVVVQVMLMSICAMSWDFLNGYVGLFSFGQAAFFGAGAYTAAILVVRGGITFAPLVLAAALGVSVVAGFVVGLLASRVRGMGVFLVTFACAETIYLGILADPGGLTYGENGLSGVMTAPLLGIDLTSHNQFYYFALVALVVSYAILKGITQSRLGRVLVGIRENELRIFFAGYNVGQYKAVAFGISALFAGFAGVLTTLHERIASPDAAAWTLSSEAVLYTTLGGTGTLVGPILGTAVVILARELLSDIVRSWLIFVGITYILLVFFLPSGLYPWLFVGRRRIAEDVRGATHPPASTSGTT